MLLLHRANLDGRGLGEKVDEVMHMHAEVERAATAHDPGASRVDEEVDLLHGRGATPDLLRGGQMEVMDVGAADSGRKEGSWERFLIFVL